MTIQYKNRTFELGEMVEPLTFTHNKTYDIIVIMEDVGFDKPLKFINFIYGATFFSREELIAIAKECIDLKEETI